MNAQKYFLPDPRPFSFQPSELNVFLSFVPFTPHGDSRAVPFFGSSTFRVTPTFFVLSLAERKQERSGIQDVKGQTNQISWLSSPLSMFPRRKKGEGRKTARKLPMYSLQYSVCFPFVCRSPRLSLFVSQRGRKEPLRCAPI